MPMPKMPVETIHEEGDGIEMTAARSTRSTRFTVGDEQRPPLNRTQPAESFESDTSQDTDNVSSSFFAPTVTVCALVCLLSQYVPYLGYYAKGTIFSPELRTDSHFGDLLFILLLFLVCCAQCFGAAQPFLLVVMLVNVVAVDLPWQTTVAFSSAREVFDPQAFEVTPQPVIGSRMDFSIGLIRLGVDIILIIMTVFELRRTEGRLFVHVRTGSVRPSTSLLFFLSGFCAFLNQLPTLIAVFLSQYFYDSCENEDLTLLQAERRYPLMSYFYSIFLLLLAGITSRVKSKVLTLLAIISICTLALLGEATACADAAVLAHKEIGNKGCQGGFHVAASVTYGLVFGFSLVLAVLLWMQHSEEPKTHDLDDD